MQDNNATKRNSEGNKTVINEAKESAVNNNLPPIITLGKALESPPPLPEALIEGLLNMGNKFLVSGPSKVGKTMLMIALSIAIASGTSWLGFNCAKGNVVYVNLEVDYANIVDRFHKKLDKIANSKEIASKIYIWNLRGYARPLDELEDDLINYVNSIGKPIAAIIIDPIYKVITGDENSATDMTFFLNIFDRVIKKTGAAIISTHHHSKGAQSGKSAMDRGSGSGVFARDVDALMDILELDLPEDIRKKPEYEGVYAFRAETILRYFPCVAPFELWYDFPNHFLDDKGILKEATPGRSFYKSANLKKSSKVTTPEMRRQSIDESFAVCCINGEATLLDMAQFLNVTERCVRDRIGEYNKQINKYSVTNNVVKIKSVRNR